MAIAIDAYSRYLNDPDCTIYSGNNGWTHTCSGADRILRVAVGTFSAGAVSVTYNGVALTKIVELTGWWSGGGTDALTLWEMRNPPSGAHTVSVNSVGAAGGRAIAFSYTGVAQSGDTPDTDVATNFNPSTFTANVTTAADGSVVTMVGFGGNSRVIAAGTNVTARSTTGRPTLLGDYTDAVAGAVAMTMTIDGSFNRWGYVAATMKPAASGVDGTGAATLTIGVSGTAVVEVVATGAATISIGASGTATIAAAEATGAATIAIGSAGTAEVAVDASGAVTIAIGASGTGTISVAVAGAATLTIGAAGTATVATVATGSATLTIGASGQVALAVTASGAAAIAIDAAGSASIPVTATGGATLAIAASGTGIVGNPPVEVDGAASIVLGASGTAVVDVTGSGATQVSLGAAGTASVAVLASGAVAVSVAVGGQAQVAIAGTAAASLSIGVSGSATVPVQASGSATLSVSATGQAGISVVAAGAAALFLDAVGSATIADAPTSFLRPLSIELLEAMGLTVTLTAAPRYSVTLET